MFSVTYGIILGILLMGIPVQTILWIIDKYLIKSKILKRIIYGMIVIFVVISVPFIFLETSGTLYNRFITKDINKSVCNIKASGKERAFFIEFNIDPNEFDRLMNQKKYVDVSSVIKDRVHTRDKTTISYIRETTYMMKFSVITGHKNITIYDLSAGIPIEISLPYKAKLESQYEIYVPELLKAGYDSLSDKMKREPWNRDQIYPFDCISLNKYREEYFIYERKQKKAIFSCVKY